MKDAQWHLAQNLSFCYTLTENSYWPKIAQGVKLQTLFLLWKVTPMGLINYIRNIPKKPSTHTFREALSFCYAVKENSGSKVIIDFLRKLYLQKDSFGLDTFM